jgi:DNA (cytosine-5)-methyltransferase 1
MGTVTAADHHAVVACHLQRDFTSSVGAAIDGPHPTITAGGGGHAALVASSLVKLKGTCRDGQPVTEPLATVQAQGRHYAEVRAFLIKYYGTDQNPQLDFPLSTVTTRDRFALVTIEGTEYAVVDIGMRMLTPRELFNAQDFPRDYRIDPVFKGKPLTKTAQVHKCGNSVPPAFSRAIVSAQFAERPARVEAAA